MKKPTLVTVKEASVEPSSKVIPLLFPVEGLIVYAAKAEREAPGPVIKAFPSETMVASEERMGNVKLPVLVP